MDQSCKLKDDAILAQRLCSCKAAGATCLPGVVSKAQGLRVHVFICVYVCVCVCVCVYVCV